MKLLIYSTNINTPEKVQVVNELFNLDNNIIDLSVDIEDIDNVLRIETTDKIDEVEVVSRVLKQGFNCVELVD